MAKINKNHREILNIDVNKISSPQTRARINFNREKLEELKKSINQHGLIHPIVLKTIRGGFEIVAGERRFMSCKELKWKTVPAEILKGTLVQQELIKVHENLKRDDLTDIEEAHFIKRIKTLTKKKDKQIAEMIGKSESYVKQKLKILVYPDYLYNAVAEGLLSFSSARELIRIEDENTLRQYVGFAINSGITPTIAKQWADEFIQRQKLQAMDEEQQREEMKQPIIEEPRFLCQSCGRAMKANETQLFRLCIDVESCEASKNKNLKEK